MSSDLPLHKPLFVCLKVICEKLEATEANQTNFITQLAKAIGARKVLEVGMLRFKLK